jgi:hypothetical protein
LRGICTAFLEKRTGVPCAFFFGLAPVFLLALALRRGVLPARAVRFLRIQPLKWPTPP